GRARSVRIAAAVTRARAPGVQSSEVLVRRRLRSAHALRVPPPRPCRARPARPGRARSDGMRLPPLEPQLRLQPLPPVRRPVLPVPGLLRVPPPLRRLALLLEPLGPPRVARPPRVE